MDSNIVLEILKKLKSQKTQGINEGLNLLKELKDCAIEEKFGRRQGNTARRNLAKIIDEFLILMKDQNWHIRYAAVRGLERIAFSDEAEARVFEITDNLLESLYDSDGKVRRATVYALDSIRIYFPDDFYVEIFLLLQDFYDGETDPKKRRSIDQALSILYCPHLEFLLLSRGFEPVAGVAS
ncbi:MAG: HEAT repeat domain-containing protein [Candidatus Hydrothermarchaeales archaeon]